MVNPGILIMDEATSSVNTVTEELIQRELEILFAGRTATVIAHRLTTVRSADRIYVIDDGRIVETAHMLSLSHPRDYIARSMSASL